MIKAKHFLIFASILLAAGCSENKTINLKLHYITKSSAPVQSTDSNAQAQLADSAVSVGQSLQQLSAIQMAVHPSVKMAQPLDPAKIGMAQQTSLNWAGPIEPLLKKIANASQYRLHVIGQKPAIPVIVMIDMRNVPLYNILRNATYQVVKKADITIYPKQRIIELRYKSN